MKTRSCLGSWIRETKHGNGVVWAQTLSINSSMAQADDHHNAMQDENVAGGSDRAHEHAAFITRI
jgi:hypothetical protein